MHLYLIAFLWGAFVLTAILGWGFLVLLLCGSLKKIDFGWQGSLGLAFSVIAGGVLNSFQLVSKNNIIIFLLIGLLVEIISLVVGLGVIKQSFAGFWASLKNRKTFYIFLVLILFTILIRYSFSVAFFNFNIVDDQHAYLVFPVKMIQTGSLGIDPFSERRLLTSLGGKYFLDTFILAGAQIKNLHIMDNGVGLIIFLLVLLGLAKDRKLSLTSVLFIVFLAAIIPSPTTNVTSFFTAAALFLALFRFLLEAEKHWPKLSGRLVVLSLLCAGVCALKSNLILPVVVIYFAYFILELKSQGNRRGLLQHFILASVMIFLFLSPWMISMLHSSGSLLYPYLGKGYGAFINSPITSYYLQFNIYSLYRVASEVVIGMGMFFPFAILVWVWFSAENNKTKKVAITALLASLMGILALIYGDGGYGLYYYSFSFLIPSVLLALVLILEKGDLPFSPKLSVSATNLGWVFLAVLVGVYIQQDVGVFQDVKSAVNIDKGSVKFGLVNSDQVPAPELSQYSTLQQAVPAGAIILARLDRNFLFNFKRNPIYIIDSPGIASPPPGLPYGQGSEVLANYLLAHNVRYVAYSYGNEANFGFANAGSMLQPHVNPLLRGETLGSFDFQDNLQQLGTTRKIIYDDGKNFVLDLKTRNK